MSWDGFEQHGIRHVSDQPPAVEGSCSILHRLWKTGDQVLTPDGRRWVVGDWRWNSLWVGAQNVSLHDADDEHPDGIRCPGRPEQFYGHYVGCSPWVLRRIGAPLPLDQQIKFAELNTNRTRSNFHALGSWLKQRDATAKQRWQRLRREASGAESEWQALVKKKQNDSMKSGIDLLNDLFANVPDPTDAVGKAGGRIEDTATLAATLQSGRGAVLPNVDPALAEKEIAASVALRDVLKGFIGGDQLIVLRDNFHCEEREFFFDKVLELAAIVTAMPLPYSTDKPDAPSPIAHLHYFAGGQANWYITERDKGVEQHQAFGLADLFGDGGELGYISIAEILANNGELDFYWDPKTLREIRAERDAPAPEENKDEQPAAASVTQASEEAVDIVADAMEATPQPADGPKKHESKTQPGLFFWAEHVPAGQCWHVVSQVTGFPFGTEAHDDWLGKFADADEIARKLAEGAPLTDPINAPAPSLVGLSLNETLALLGMKMEKVGAYWHVTYGDKDICREASAMGVWRELVAQGFIPDPEAPAAPIDVAAENEALRIEGEQQ